jgi:protein SCO1/2
MKRKLLLAVLIVVPTLCIASVLAFSIFRPIQVLPRIRLSPGFSLTDQDGQRLTNEDLRGKIVLYSFGCAHCGPPGPQSIQMMREVQDRLDEVDFGEIPFKMVTISFDPEHDTPDVLRAYAEEAGADPDLWRFVTGDPTRLKYILGSGFEVYYKPNEDGSFTFDQVFVLVDGWGIIRGDYRYQTVATDTDRILRHIGVLVEEVQQSQGSARLAYEAAHFFLCYAP